ncbi:hypothetical protein FPOA_06365 [Fusarium poae]|uniref:Zn(2)-C6 fungal-type domain-containing protein n=1 Tax=Fusarium poae TaxID=36050 RepID=A0A1B8AZA3_FUSPO|nr:hypothetical protein FPOA_06365 [Fusarium poae]
MSDRDDDVTPQRKRIAVACGRCRKRKIRCSGDTGNGGPCTNCKNAGYEPCQFLRVASQETTLKGESFTYSLEASRQYQARGSSAISSLSASTPSYTDGIPAYTTEAFVYRNPANFTYGTKSYCPLAWGNGYADDQSYNYALYQPAYSPVHDSDYSMSYRIASGTPGKSALCVDAEPSYSYSSGNTMTNLVHRPAQAATESTAYNLVPDSKNVAFQNMASDPKGLALQNMAAGVNTGERVLPAPVVRSSMSSSIGSSYKNDSDSSIYSNNSSSSSKSSQDSTSETSPVSSTSETPSSYTSYESSTSSCLPSYPPITQYGRSGNDLYSHTGSSDTALFASSQGGPDMTYRYTDTTAGVTVPVAAAGRRDLPHLNGNGLGTFSLGHAAASYLPHHGTAYMLPTGGDIGGDAASEHIRRSAGAGSL